MNKTIKLKEVCNFQEGYVNPSQKIPEYFGNDVKWIRVNDLNDGTVYNTSRMLSTKGFESAKKSAKLFKPNTIVISKSGTIGKLSIIKDYMCGNRAIINIEVNNLEYKTEYIFYWLKLNRKYIQNSAVGSVQKNLYVSILGEFEIPYLSLESQEKIIPILKSLDDKIELNNQMNQTLEEMAQAVFKEWFVEFNFPNEDGVPYKDNGGEMVESELGMIPKGWRVGTIGGVLELPYGKALKKTERVPGKFPVVGSSGIVDYNDKSFVKGPGIVIGRKGTIGKVIFLEEDFFPIDTTFYVKSKLGIENDLYYLNYVLLNQDFQHISSDSAVPGLNRNQAYMNPIIQPSSSKVEGFIKVIKPIFDKIQKNNIESKTLIKTRDTLLPKLMSGEVRV